MADRYARSADGSNSDDGSTWALAKLDGAGLAAIDTAGDRLFFSDNHAETTAAAITWAIAGTLATPSMLICGDDAAEPPTAVADTGTVTTTGTSTITLGGHFYCYGLSFRSGTGAGGGSIQLVNNGSELQRFKKCQFIINSTTSSARWLIGRTDVATYNEVVWENCDARNGSGGASADQQFTINAKFTWRGGTWLSGGSAPNVLFAPGVRSAEAMLVEGVDFSNLGTATAFFGVGSAAFTGVIRNCKLPPSWSGSLVAGTQNVGQRYEMHNCDSLDTNYRLWVEDYTGSVKSETTIVRTGGASDGTTPISWKMTGSSNAEFPSFVLRAPEIAVWNDVVGTPITVTVEIATQGVALNDDEAWLEVQSLGPTGSPSAKLPSLFMSDAKAHVLATAQMQTVSTESWPQLGSPGSTQKLSVTLTAQSAGYLLLTPCLSKASAIVFVCPKPTVS